MPGPRRRLELPGPARPRDACAVGAACGHSRIGRCWKLRLGSRLRAVEVLGSTFRLFTQLPMHPALDTIQDRVQFIGVFRSILSRIFPLDLRRAGHTACARRITSPAIQMRSQKSNLEFVSRGHVTETTAPKKYQRREL